MLLAVDIGNTNIHAGLFYPDSMRLTGGFTAGAREIPLNGIPALELDNVTGCILASVNPEAEDAFCGWLKSRWNGVPLRIPADVPVNIPVLVENPGKVGVDRLLNAIAAYRRTGTATVVVDAGTAVTVDVVSGKGEFMGGVIAPGLESLKEALHMRTALLPEVSVQKPHGIAGKDTAEAVKSGLYWGIVGAVEKITEKLVDELGGRPRVLVTGGEAELLAEEIKLFDEVVPHLTLEGIVTAYNNHLGLGSI